MRELLLLAVLCGCGSEPCERPTGLWLLHATERSGSCGDISDRLFHLGPDDTERQACGSVHYDWAPDNCSFESELKGCVAGDVLTDQNMSMTQRSPNEWAGVASAMLYRSSDGYACRSAYDVTATKR